MCKRTIPMVLAGLMLGAVLMAAAPYPAAAEGYADDRARILDLQARYMFAMDWQDAETYAGTFTQDGVLVSGFGTYRGRDEIKGLIDNLAEKEAYQAEEGDSNEIPPRTRHHIDNVVLNINGDTATGVAYWTMLTTNNAERRPEVQAFGHYEDKLVKKDGEWYFKRREIYNVVLPERMGSAENPASGL